MEGMQKLRKHAHSTPFQTIMQRQWYRLLFFVSTCMLLCGYQAAADAALSAYREADAYKAILKRELTDDKCKDQYQCEGTVAVVPAGETRVMELTAPSMSLFEVNLSASPAWLWPQGNAAATAGYGRIASWPKQPECSGSAVIAAAFRADRVPPGFIVPKAPAIRALLTKPVTQPTGADPQLKQYFNTTFNQALPAAESPLMYYNGCRNADPRTSHTPGVWWVPVGAVLNYTATHGPNSVLEWPPQGSQPQTAPGCSSHDLDCYKSTLADNLNNRALYVAIPLGDGKQNKSCGVCGSKVYVYIHNCYQQPGADLLVSVGLHKFSNVPHDERCYTKRDQTAYILQVVSLILMGVCVLAFLLPLGLSVVAALMRKCKKVKQDDGDAGDMAPSRESWRMYKAILTTMHNPSGYSRLYTVTVVTTAALLIASIVWPPTVNPAAQHDHAWYDSLIAPRQSTYTENKGHVITYYLKVMWLSALVGHTVKLALLANLSPPHPSSCGISVPLKVWKAQRLVSGLGFAVLTFLVGSSLFYMLLQWRVWINIWAYWWLMACILANFAVALVSFILFTFIKVPPLSTPFIENHTPPTSPAAASAANKPGKQSQHSINSTAKPPAVFSGASLKLSRDQQLPSPPAVPPTPGGFNPWRPAPAEHADQHAKQQPGQDPCLFSPFEQQQREQQSATCGQRCDAAAAAGVGPSPAGGANAAARSPTAAAGGTTQQQTKQKGSVGDAGKRNCCQQTGAALVAAGRWLRARPAWCRTAVLEEEGVRYSAWVLAPVWLTCYLIFFWWLMGVEHSDGLLNCLSDPVQCVSAGHMLDSQAPSIAGSGQQKMAMMKQVLELSGKQTMLLQGAQQSGCFNMTALQQAAGIRLPEGVGSQTSLNDMMLAVTQLSNEYDFGRLSAGAMDIYDQYQQDLEFARLIGRWLGYSLATAFACFSLWRIVMSFKHGIVVAQQWEQYWREHPEEKAAIMDAGAEENTTQARKLAKVMATMQGDARDKVAWAQAITGINAGGAAQYPAMKPLCADVSALPVHHDRLYATQSLQYPPVVPQLSGQQPQLGETLPSAALSLHSATSTHDAAPPGAGSEEQGLSTHLMDRVQQQQEDMQKVGIGASVALFGVLISTMWIQIRFVGFILTMLFTIAAHPMFWDVALQQGWLVAVACLIALVAFNILVVKIFIGSRLLSNGTYIKHPGTWMTYFLMFQLGFMVIGWLYSLWRILLALLIMLLYSVAALDRSLLHTAKFLDGPYKTFLASVKLEGAYRRISEGLPYTDTVHRRPASDKQMPQGQAAVRQGKGSKAGPKQPQLLQPPQPSQPPLFKPPDSQQMEDQQPAADALLVAKRGVQMHAGHNAAVQLEAPLEATDAGPPVTAPQVHTQPVLDVAAAQDADDVATAPPLDPTLQAAAGAGCGSQQLPDLGSAQHSVQAPGRQPEEEVTVLVSVQRD